MGGGGGGCSVVNQGDFRPTGCFLQTSSSVLLNWVIKCLPRLQKCPTKTPVSIESPVTGNFHYNIVTAFK